MSHVSTSAQLLSALKLDDFIYGFVGAKADEQQEEDDGVSLWNIPGLGAVGVGTAVAALIAIYVAHPEIKEALITVLDLFGDEASDPERDKQAEKIGAAGEKTDPKAPVKTEGEPRIAEAVPVAAKAPKAEPPMPAAGAPGNPTVSTGAQIAGSGMPLPSGPLARPSAEINTVLQNTAKSEGVDYRTLYALGGAESGFSAGANAKNSSATGLFQFTAPTWTYLTTKVYPELGYTMSDRTDPQKSAVVASRYIKTIGTTLQKKLGRAPTLGETYLGYFMGTTGASQFLDALEKNPNAKSADVFPKAAASNPYLFYHKGDKNKPLTLSETMGRLDGKVTAYYEQANQTMMASSGGVETAPPLTNGGGPKPIAVKAALPADAAPQAVAVPAPDFNAALNSAKGEARNDEQPKGKQQAAGPQGKPTPIATSGGSKEQTAETTYVRDRQGRLIAIRS